MTLSHSDELWINCALAGFVNANPLDDGHMERSKLLAYKYYEDEKCRINAKK